MRSIRSSPAGDTIPPPSRRSQKRTSSASSCGDASSAPAGAGALVAEGRVDQLFLATHSNLFDLDPSGYWDVSLVEGATTVQRKPLDEVDRLHLFEPGPAKHQIQELLRIRAASRRHDCGVMSISGSLLKKLLRRGSW